MSYFPLLIEYTANPGKYVEIKSPEELPSGVAFKVIKTNYKGE